MFYFFFDPVAVEFGVITEAELQKRIQIESKLERVTGEPSRLQYWSADLRGADWALEIAVREFDEGLTSEVIRIVDRFDPEDPKPAIYPSRAGEAMEAETEHFLQLVCSGGQRGGKARTTRHAV
jgi:hypothetical protein